MSAEFVRIENQAEMPGSRAVVGGCYGGGHEVCVFNGNMDDRVHAAFPNFDSFNNEKEEFFIDLKLEARPKTGKAISGDFVGAAVIHQESKTINPSTSIVIVEVDCLTDNGDGWNGNVNPDGYTATKVAQEFCNSKFLSSAHNFATRIRDKGLHFENGKVVRNTLVGELSSGLVLPVDKKLEIPSQRFRAIYSIWLGSLRYDGDGTIDWLMMGSTADIEGYKGASLTEKSGNIQFGMLTRAVKLIGDDSVDRLDSFARRAGLSTDQTYAAKVGYEYDVLGPFPTIERGAFTYKRGVSHGNMSILLASDGLRRNNTTIANEMVCGKVDILQPDPLLLTNDKDDSSYAFLNIGVY